MKRRKLEPVSQQENRARYKREDRKLSSLIKEFNDSADWQTIQQTALPKEIVETRDTLERLAPALHELKRGAPVMKRKHEASQDYQGPDTQLENVNPSYNNMFGDGYVKRRKLEPVSQQENRARYKGDKGWNDSADWETILQTYHPQEIVEIKRLAPALQELKRDAPVMKRKHEASQDYRAASEPYESRDDVAYIDPTQLENVNPSYTNQPLFGDGYAIL